MLQPEASYPPQALFAQRIEQLRHQKAAVAARAAELIGDGWAVFVGDGSSTFYLGLALLNRPELVRIWTNHLAVAHEYCLRGPHYGLDVELIGGAACANLMMTRPAESDPRIDQCCAQAQAVVLSARAILGHEGPVGAEHDSLRVKQRALAATLDRGVSVIFVADHSKLEHARRRLHVPPGPVVFQTEAEWVAAMRRPNLFVVTTHRPGLDPNDLPFRPHPNTPEEWYCYNATRLKATMNERFIQIPPPPENV